jgi:hypothetical protein
MQCEDHGIYEQRSSFRCQGGKDLQMDDQLQEQGNQDKVIWLWEIVLYWHVWDEYAINIAE